MRRTTVIAKDLMTAPAATIDADVPLVVAATVLAEAGQRLYVTSRAELVGVLARCDLLRVFDRPDDELLAEVIGNIDRHAPASRVEVAVHDSVVTLLGTTARRSTARLIEQLAAEVAGVIAVDNRLTYSADDR